MRHAFRPSRRSFLSTIAGAAASAGFVGGAGATSPQCPAGAVPPLPTVLPPNTATPLGQLASAKNLLFGVQTDGVDQNYGGNMYDPVYRQLILREKPAYIAYGNGFKFGQVCPDPPGPNYQLKFTQAQYGVTDTWFYANDLTSLFKSSGTRGRADALIWIDNPPAWLAPLPPGQWWLSQQYKDNITYMTAYISAAMKKMLELSAGDPNYFHAVGVVNEPINPFDLVNGHATYKSGPFSPPGISVIDQAIPGSYIWSALYQADYYSNYWAQQLGVAPSKAKHFVNESLADTDQFGPILRPAILSLVRKLKAKNVRIDAVGLESHLQPQMMADPYHPDWTAFGNFIQALGALGVEVHITELDVLDYEANCFGAKASAASSDSLTALYYQTFLAKVLSYPAVKSVCAWDLSDRYTFYRILDESSWFGYDAVPRPKPAAAWPRCNTMPPNAAAISCPRSDLYDDRMIAKSARQAMSNAIAGAPSR